MSQIRYSERMQAGTGSGWTVAASRALEPTTWPSWRSGWTNLRRCIWGASLVRLYLSRPDSSSCQADRSREPTRSSVPSRRRGRSPTGRGSRLSVPPYLLDWRDGIKCGADGLSHPFRRPGEQLESRQECVQALKSSEAYAENDNHVTEQRESGPDADEVDKEREERGDDPSYEQGGGDSAHPGRK